MKIAVIPARLGSKRIHKKNIKNFAGKPIIAWSILAAIESKIFDKIIVSTDSNEISEIANNFGAETPFLRPKQLSDDITPTVPVISHAIQATRDATMLDIDYCCCIYPCSPLIQSSDLVDAFDMLLEKKAHFVYPITEYPHPIQRALKINGNGEMSFVTPQFEMTRTQDLAKTYHDCGQFYWGKTESWINELKMHSNGIGIVIPHWRTVDIDNEEDWIRAELLFKALREQ